MIFRCRLYHILPGKVDEYNRFFEDRLFPLQQRYGARLVARLQDVHGTRVLAVWAYDDMDQYRSIQSRIRLDPDHHAAMEYRNRELGPFCSDWEEWMMTSNVPLEATLLSHLASAGPSFRGAELTACTS